ncbi:MAG: polysaccharide biosynthesis protein [Candidatus Peregrinibacteria bacterium GW2011_GWE2_39_6]|nr:MAG: polysaccharide biosynthesis protein [Candidatus Peregrinibacteria bacterium GW2011_GWF2_39_17]KKR23697.1 MAG: polysaccharide biosynthesis protein [Candidatus Peregrinibacteria bacterium GW2011_GWE2_39_6]HCW32564.1 hypothetical protein [Candidatus Peregrinibacteria bacterium]
MNRHHTVFRNLLYLYGSELGTKSVSLLLFLVLVNSLGDVRFGQYSFAVAFVTIFNVIIDAGIMAYTTREIARNKSHYSIYFWYALLWKIPLIFIAFILMTGILWILKYNQDIFILIGLAGVMMVLDNLNTLFRSFFQAFEKMAYIAIPRFFEKLLLLIIVTIFTWKGATVSLIFKIIIGVYGFSFFTTLFLALRYLPYPKMPHFQKNTFFLILKTAIPFALFNFFGLIYLHFDTLMISQFLGDAAVGWYNAAYQPILVLYFIAGLMMTAIYPIMSEYYTKSSSQLSLVFTESLRFLMIVGLPLSMGITLIAPSVVPFAFGISYIPAIPALQILAWVLLFAFLNSGLSTFLNSSNRQHLNLLTTGFGLFFNIATNFYFIPRYGIVGAALTTLMTEIVVFGLSCFFVNRVVSLFPFVFSIIKPILITGIMAIIILILPPVHFIIMILLGVLIYSFFCLFLGVIGVKEKEFVRHFLQPSP